MHLPGFKTEFTAGINILKNTEWLVIAHTLEPFEQFFGFEPANKFKVIIEFYTLCYKISCYKVARFFLKFMKLHLCGPLLYKIL